MKKYVVVAFLLLAFAASAQTTIAGGVIVGGNTDAQSLSIENDSLKLQNGGGFPLSIIGGTASPKSYTEAERAALTGQEAVDAAKFSYRYEISENTPLVGNPDILYVQRTTGGDIDNTWAVGAGGEQIINVINNTSTQTWTLGTAFTSNKNIEIVKEGTSDAYILPQTGTNFVGMADDNAGNFPLTAGMGIALRQYLKIKFEKETSIKFWFYGSAEPYTN